MRRSNAATSLTTTPAAHHGPQHNKAPLEMFAGLVQEVKLVDLGPREGGQNRHAGAGHGGNRFRSAVAANRPAKIASGATSSDQAHPSHMPVVPYF